MDVKIGDLVETKKKHPCGSVTWVVIRTGMDIKMKCQGCGRIVMLDREKFEKRVKRILETNETKET
ncbi:DUF951 domain-containing protein [Alkalibacter rhizosphaerae]|uniref:DUF951 domain-containing protein n=1 Tax=Alkalibacter rhizosphaerae TaxID=2815577 RepID=A0A975AH27_9FIRM|nr:DUF951 domain-containing protein [Alkalibacter rhizosphaerae]QSX07568.1 DUF951 domain-containing protein [Alkalibacter rhizosphaerae]